MAHQSDSARVDGVDADETVFVEIFAHQLKASSRGVIRTAQVRQEKVNPYARASPET